MIIDQLFITSIVSPLLPSLLLPLLPLDPFRLLIGNNWLPMRYGGDNFQVGSTPAKWATDFERALFDVIRDNKVCATGASGDDSHH